MIYVFDETLNLTQLFTYFYSDNQGAYPKQECAEGNVLHLIRPTHTHFTPPNCTPVISSEA